MFATTTSGGSSDGAAGWEAVQAAPAPGLPPRTPGQAPAPAPKDAPQQPIAPEAAPPPQGTVLFERKTDESGEDAPPVKSAAPLGKVSTQDGVSDPEQSASAEQSALTAERSALTFVAYDLDLHLVPLRSEAAMHARFKVRNDGSAPLLRLRFQLSSSLHWERFALAVSGAAVPFVQHLIDTDADHTGQAQEAVVTLPQPLQAGREVELSAFYSGSIGQSGRRLERIGAPADQAARADWDSVGPEQTALRGFGNVLWYPTAAPPEFLGDGAKLFQAVAQAKLRQASATIHLRLTVEYAGDAPKLAFFCGRREAITAVTEDVNAPSVSAPGVASVDFPLRPLGFRVPSLFIPDGALSLQPTSGAVLSALTESDHALALYDAAAARVQPLLVDWLGETPLRDLNILDHKGQPFEDQALLVAPMANADTAEISGVLVHALSHAWFVSSHIWLDEGMAQFMGWLWTEQSAGREVALEQIRQQTATLAFAEPAPASPPSSNAPLANVAPPNAAPATGAPAGTTANRIADITAHATEKDPRPVNQGQSLIGASSEIYYRTKAAAVLKMLQSLVGDAALKQALRDYRKAGKLEEDPKEFERVLEAASHKDLRWFFDDWVYRDRGLPDLAIVSVSPRELTAKDGRGGWLVAVEVRNDGDAAAEVPVTVRSGTLTATVRVRVMGRSSASTRVLFESDPAEVVMNDGTVPEVGNGMHVWKIKGR